MLEEEYFYVIKGYYCRPNLFKVWILLEFLRKSKNDFFFILSKVSSINYLNQLILEMVLASVSSSKVVERLQSMKKEVNNSLIGYNFP
jgi:hypothetical protein